MLVSLCTESSVPHRSRVYVDLAKEGRLKDVVHPIVKVGLLQEAANRRTSLGAKCPMSRKARVTEERVRHPPARKPRLSSRGAPLPIAASGRAPSLASLADPPPCHPAAEQALAPWAAHSRDIRMLAK